MSRSLSEFQRNNWHYNFLGVHLEVQAKGRNLFYCWQRKYQFSSKNKCLNHVWLNCQEKFNFPVFLCSLTQIEERERNIFCHHFWTHQDKCPNLHQGVTPPPQTNSHAHADEQRQIWRGSSLPWIRVKTFGYCSS